MTLRKFVFNSFIDYIADASCLMLVNQDKIKIHIYSSWEASGQGHLQVSFQSNKGRHQDEYFSYHLKYFPVLENTKSHIEHNIKSTREFQNPSPTILDV